MGPRLVPTVVLIIFSVSPLLAFVIENSSDLIHGRIIGGEDSPQNRAPYVVSLFLKGRHKDKPYCGGSILSKQWIITAAHCLKEPHYRIVAVAGLQNIDISNASKSQTRRSDFYVKHGNYSKNLGATGGYDIGLLHLVKPFEFTDYVQAIVFSEQTTLEGLMRIFGWGRISTESKLDYPEMLQMAEIGPVERSVCELEHNTTIGVGTFCAGGAEHNKGACVGDSGGPLVQNNILVGIVSWGPITCRPKDGPTIFTNVGYYNEWIKEKIGNDRVEVNLI